MGYLDYLDKDWKRLQKGYSSGSKKYERVPVSSEQKFDVLKRQKGKCAWPSCKINFHRDGIKPHFDHIKRVEKGGPSLVSNIQALCPNHHDAKTSSENLEKIEKARRKTRREKSNDSFGFDSTSFKPTGETAKLLKRSRGKGIF